MPIELEAARWGIRLLLGREPRDEAEVQFHAAGHATVPAFRECFFKTIEAKQDFRRYNSEFSTYNVPAFFLEPPVQRNVRYRFAVASLSSPTSQMCTAEQMRSPIFAELGPKVGISGTHFHRKLWEWVYIYQVLKLAGFLRPGQRGLGFGTGSEPLPSAFANCGASILATDAPPELENATDWTQGNQWTSGRDDLFNETLVNREVFDKNVQFAFADMNNIPAHLTKFDFCWSSCCLEHLGSIANGLNFIRNSLATLRPGGIAVHTTELNLSSNDVTLDEFPTCLFRKKDIEQHVSELTDEGHDVEPLNFWPGCDPVDTHVDVPPYTPLHVKIQVANFLTTSFGLIVRKSMRQ